MTEISDDTLIDADDVTGAFLAQRNASVSQDSVDGDAVLTDRRTGRTHILNGTAAVVWDCLDGTGTLNEVSRDIAEVSDDDITRITADVVELVRDLGRQGLIKGVRAEVPDVVIPSGPSTVPRGSALPEFRLPDLQGAEVTNGDLRGRRLLLVNWSVTCGYCDRIAPDLRATLGALHDRGIELLLVSTGEVEANQAKIDELDLPVRVLLNNANQLDVFQGVGTPSAYVVDEDLRIDSELAYGALAVPELVREQSGT